MADKTKILFICLGNICRSPAAEGVFLHKIEGLGLRDGFEVDSAGLHGYHEGELADRRMRDRSYLRGYKLVSRSRPVIKKDFDYFDYIFAMDEANIRALKGLATIEQFKKITKLSNYCSEYNTDSIPDPYYGSLDDFDHVLDLLEDACDNLIETLIK